MKNTNKVITFCDEIIGDGITYRYIVTHMFNSFKVMSQVIREENGIELPRDQYILVRKNSNNIVIEFKSPPFKDEKFYVLLVKVD